MEVLHKAIRGQQITREMLHVVPLHLTERQSSSPDVTDDLHLSLALKYIRDNFLNPIQVNDVVRFVGISRRSLERRFNEQIHRTIAEEIEKRRLERAKHLLLNSSDPVVKISILSGFENLQPMLRLFQEEWGMTPTEFRNRHRD